MQSSAQSPRVSQKLLHHGGTPQQRNILAEPFYSDEGMFIFLPDPPSSCVLLT